MAAKPGLRRNSWIPCNGALPGSEKDHQGNRRKRQPGPQGAPAKIVLQVRFIPSVEREVSGGQKREESERKHPARQRKWRQPACHEAGEDTPMLDADLAGG